MRAGRVAWSHHADHAAPTQPRGGGAGLPQRQAARCVRVRHGSARPRARGQCGTGTRRALRPNRQAAAGPGGPPAGVPPEVGARPGRRAAGLQVRTGDSPTPRGRRRGRTGRRPARPEAPRGEGRDHQPVNPSPRPASSRGQVAADCRAHARLAPTAVNGGTSPGDRTPASGARRPGGRARGTRPRHGRKARDGHLAGQGAPGQAPPLDEAREEDDAGRVAVAHRTRVRTARWG
jgi:hypothetical protein